ncbi:hypothetical protein C8J56DRAFT_964434 [Mycena floridula]|nr:hypothetical protein C8J56DRAFT_964434 [Mycena floridula]
MNAKERHQAVFLVGPWLLGSFLDVFLQGILMCQFAHYWSWYKEDRLFLKLMVAGLAILTILKSFQSIAIVWIQNILHLGDVKGAVRLITTKWWQAGNPLIVATMCLYAQAFFLSRLYIISQNKWIVIPLGLVFLTAYALMVVAEICIHKGIIKVGKWFAGHLSAVFVADILMSLATTYYLLKSRNSGLQRTRSVIDSLVRLTLSSAVPAALCAMLNLIFSQIYPGTENLISTTFNQALPKLYAISILWVLNERRNIRALEDSFNPNGLIASPDLNGRHYDNTSGYCMQLEAMKRTVVDPHKVVFRRGSLKDNSDINLHQQRPSSSAQMLYIRDIKNT